MSRFVVDSPSYSFRPMEKQGGFDPRYLFYGGLDGVYFNAQDRGTIYSTPSLDTIASVGGSVGGMGDSSPSKHNLGQGTASSRPTLRQRSSGQFYLEFDSDDDFLVNNTIDFPQPNTLIVSFRTSDVSTFFRIIDGRSLGFERSQLVSQADSSTLVAWSGTLLNGQATVTEGQIHVASVVFDGANSEIYLDGKLDVTGDAGTNGLDGLTVAARADEQVDGPLDLFGMVIVNGILVPSLRQRTERALVNSAGKAI